MAVVFGTQIISGDVLDGLIYAAPNTHVTVKKNVLVFNSSGNSVTSAQPTSTVVNKGIIYSGGNLAGGVHFSGDDAVVINRAGGLIKGYSGVVITGVDAKIANRGTVIASGDFGFGVQLGSTSSKATLDNQGDILSKNRGVYVVSASDGSLIKNAGLIAGDTSGVSVSTGAGAKTRIVNQTDGTIKGGVQAAIDTFLNLGGKIALTNKGTIVGKIDLNANLGNVNDKVVNKAGGVIKGTVELGLGNDSFVFAGGKQGTVFGEAGADRFDFKTKVVTGKDAAKIGDMTPGTDTIGVSKKLFGDIGPKGEALKGKYFQVGKKADDANDRIIYDKASGKLFFDPDGNGSKGQKLFAKLDDGLDLKAGDFLVIA